MPHSWRKSFRKNESGSFLPLVAGLVFTCTAALWGLNRQISDMGRVLSSETYLVESRSAVLTSLGGAMNWTLKAAPDTTVKCRFSSGPLQLPSALVTEVKPSGTGRWIITVRKTSTVVPACETAMGPG